MNKEAVIFHIPHASLSLPKELLGDVLVPYERVQREALETADLYCDALFDFPFGQKIVFPHSRLICDPERFPDDAQEPMAQKGQGLFYTRLTDGTRFRTSEFRDTIKSSLYDSHHTELEAAVDCALQEFGECLIIDCHSFNPQALGFDESVFIPNVCLGTDDFHTPSDMLTKAIKAVTNVGESYCIDHPYSGTIVPMKHYKKDLRVHSIMIELSRGLYLRDDFDISNGYIEARKICENIVYAIT